ncbi:MAG: LysR family transcriptional regulator [Phormidesmis sp. RL_2_1]|nr:LysR family transcriptional regulator [Phormidesmis sp. RL_2_1]
MNLSGVDLNLLVVLDALMTERHVTRAGERIGLSQPATSNALARLRNLTHDALFVRSGGALHPTPVAIALAQQIQPALQQIQTALSPAQPFDPMTSDRVFNIGMSDYVEFVLLPRLLEKLETTAPHLKIQVRSGDRRHSLALLDSGEIDLLCGVFPEAIAWHREQLLFQEQFVCVCRRDHPLIDDSISLQDYVSVSHLLVSVKEDMVGRVDHLLEEQNLTRHISLSIPHFLVAPSILARTNLITTMAERVACEFVPTQNLKILPCPLPLKGFSVFMRWHQSTHDNAIHTWFRSILTEVAIKV